MVKSDATVATVSDIKTVLHVDMELEVTENDAGCVTEADVEHVAVVAEAARKTVQHAKQPENLSIFFNSLLILKET